MRHQPAEGHRHHDRGDSYAYGQAARQSFHHPRTSLGAPGHLLHLTMVAAPIIIGECVKDPDKKWRALRLIPIIGGLGSELLWTLKIAEERRRAEESRAALEECHERRR